MCLLLQSILFPLPLLLHPIPPAGVQQLPGEPARLFGGQQHNDVGHVLRAAQAPQRRVGHDGGLGLRGDVAGLRGAGGYDIDGDAVAAQLGGGGAGVRFDSVLAGGIADVGHVGVGGVGAHGDDAPVSIGGRGVAVAGQVTPGVLGHEQRVGAGVHPKVGVDAGGGERLDAGLRVHARRSNVSSTQ